MLRVVVFLLLLLGCCLCVAPSPSCPPGVKNCVPPSPASATVVGEYPIEVTSSLPKDTWKKHPFGAATVYEVSLAADSAACGICNSPSSITVDQHGLVTSCTSTPPSPAAGFYRYPSNLLVSSEGMVESVDNDTSPSFENVTAETITTLLLVVSNYTSLNGTVLINGVPYSGGANYTGADRQIDVTDNVISVAMPFEKFIPYGQIFTLITQDAFGNNYTLSYDGDLLYLSGFEVKIASDSAVKFEGVTEDSSVYMTGSGCVGCTNVPPANTQIGDWTATRTFSDLYGTSGGSIKFNGAGGITIADSSNNASLSFSNNGYSFGAASTLPVLGNQVYGVHVFAGGPSGTNSTYPNIAGFSSSRYVMMFANDRIWWRRTVTGWLTPLRPSDVSGTTGQVTVTATNTGVTLSYPSNWAPTVSTMSVTATGPQMRTYMDTNTEWGVYDNSISRNVLNYERTYRALTFGQRLMVEEEATIGTSIQLFGGACNPSPFSFGGSVALAGSQSVFKITLVTGSGTCDSSSAAFQFLWTWTGANVVVCTATPQTSATIDVPLGVDASPTGFVGRVGSVPFSSGQTYVWNVMCVGTATQTVIEDYENEDEEYGT